MLHMETVEDRDIQSSFNVLGQSRDFPSVGATVTYTKDITVLMLALFAVKVSIFLRKLI